ncbi:membrane steroid-binding protein 2-like isoform X2 [Vigna unguiculata]|uniref:membrane steroid-binding protein 2-like isoform X2 n=1 Tax=Vigna unguiculata TaxID=3917 RepID=UPI001016AE4C|nr:membrane steroid-binding protein 2-like isoform X2 [Vigna unguiculata]
MSLHTSVMEEITFYTGLSPAAFFTLLAMMVVVYRTVSAMFVSPEDYNKPPVVSARTHPQFEDPEPPRQPVQLGQVTDQELRAYDGSDPNKPLLMAIRGQIFDVSTGRNMVRVI